MKRQKLELVGSLPRAYSNEQTAELVERLRAGDGSAREPLINGLLRLAAARAGEAASKWRDLEPRPVADDLFSAACVGLCNGVDALARTLPTGKDNPTGYLIRWMDEAIKNELFPDGVPDPSVAHAVPMLEDPSDDERSDTRMWERLTDLCDDETDVDILRLKQDRCTFVEIGKYLGISATTANDRFRRIETRAVASGILPAERQSDVA